MAIEAAAGAAGAGGAAAGAITPMGWLMAGSTLLGGAMRGSPAGPSSANSMFATELVFDNSGWNVAYGGSKIDSEASKSTSQGGVSGMGEMSSYLPFFAVAVGAVVLWKITKSKASK